VGERPLRVRAGPLRASGPGGESGGALGHAGGRRDAGPRALLRCGWAAGRKARSWAGMAAAGPARGKGGGEVGRPRDGLRGEMSGGGRLRPKEGGSRVGFFLFNFFLFSLLPTT
jgi:hypothetical protein